MIYSSHTTLIACNPGRRKGVPYIHNVNFIVVIVYTAIIYSDAIQKPMLMLVDRINYWYFAKPFCA